MIFKSLSPVVLTLAASTLFLTACGEQASEVATKEEVSQSEAADTDQKAVLKAQVDNAKKTTKVFASSLKGELQKAMKAGGPVNALSVCNTEAMPITEKVAKEQGAQLSRVSLKNRNPENAPNDWQTVVLKDFG